mgnify:CR=1 FL=1
MIATRSCCCPSFLPENMIVSPVLIVFFPKCVHLDSLTPKMCNLFCFISLKTCACFPVSYMVWIFQKPALSLVLTLRTLILLLVSCWLSLTAFTCAGFCWCPDTWRTIELFLVLNSVIKVFLQEGEITQPPTWWTRDL